MKFCSLCAAPLEERIPEGEDRLRKVCTACGEVHYVNPRMVVGCVVEDGDRLLLCRRAIEPALGAWTPPGSTATGSARRSPRTSRSG